MNEQPAPDTTASHLRDADERPNRSSHGGDGHNTQVHGNRDHEHGDHSGHGDHGDHAEMFRRKFWLSLALTVPTVVYSHMSQDLLGYSAPMIPGHRWIAPVFGVAVFLYGGPVFLEGGWSELKARKPGMMLLISMGLLVALGASIANEVGWLDIDLWFELATLVTIMLLGHWLEMRAIGQAQGALGLLAELLPDDAERVGDDGELETVPIAALTTGDTVLVRPGGRVPADGRIVDGAAELDESTVTGESRPVPRSVGDRVVAGTVATDSAVRITVTAVGDDTALAGIQRLVADAQASRSRAQALADRFAAWLFYVAFASGILTFVVWSLIGDVDQAVVRTVTVLVIACPHALGLAIPLVVSISTSMSARAGILVKDRVALERMRSIDAVLFDKTGTLTKGDHAVVAVLTAGRDEAEVLGLAASVEGDSEHPLARAIIDAAKDKGSTVTAATNFRANAGRGVTAEVDGRPYRVGGPAMLRDAGLTSPPALAEGIEHWRLRGAAVLYLVEDESIIAALVLEDEVRPESREAVDALHRLGVRVVMITGDAQQVADAVGEELGVDEVFAEVLPEDKDRAVIDLQERGLRVAMVGDGVNDAPALARADVGLAIGAGTDVAIESAGVVLASSDPRSVLGVLTLSKATYRKMVQNLAWGAGYNVVAIPLAAGVLAFAGITLSPAVGAILMSASTVVVALNAQLLRRVELRPDDVDNPDVADVAHIATGDHAPIP
jgi:Cu2+-exporting ATPase